MTDHNHKETGAAQPIHLEGETWAPPAEDDVVEAQPRHGICKVFVGRDGLRAGWSLLIFIVMLVAGVMSASFLMHKLHLKPAMEKVGNVVYESPSAPLYTHGILFVTLVIAGLIMSRIEKRPFGNYGIDSFTPHRCKQFIAGLFWGLVLLSLLIFTLKFAGLLVFDGRALFGTEVFTYGIKWAASFLLVALMEEYLLRGYMQFTIARGIAGLLGQSPYRRAVGFWISAIIFAFVFGLGHKGNPGESPLGLIMAGTVGLVFSFSLWRTGSLWWAIGWHTAWDWAESYFYGVADSGLMVKGHLFNTHSVGTPLMSGGATGPEGSIFVLPVLILTALVIFFTLKPEGWPSHQE